ncbi:WhiB family transcriptional regulator [Frankia sp. R82]|uniref:WhiB family transcriptional regulator n=1 Tax=Frankia sp. R82 TaxID=2950553 RepID=UPI0020442605|nr:WhiB family transcriptional regulator [Frankia sp. R82]MCM3884151.1 WhiB family transcriptional regulator [Frankia sp. R82]
MDRTGEHWTWTGPVDPRGAGRFYVGQQQIRPHHAVLLLEGSARPAANSITRQSCASAGCIRHWSWKPEKNTHRANTILGSVARPMPRKAPPVVGDSVGWESRALCAGTDNPDFFFPDSAEDSRAVQRFCRPCPVQVECGTAAIARGEEHGVWAGMSQMELRRAVRQVAESRQVVAA